jgi:hypothetical protein
LPAPRRPVHFFFTAGCAAGRDGAFCLAMYALPFFVDEKRLAQVGLICRWGNGPVCLPSKPRLLRRY